MTVAHALRALLLALVLHGLGGALGAQTQGACGGDDCGCPHEVMASDCCCAGEPLAAPVRLRASWTQEELLAELRQERRASGPVMRDGRCGRARRALAERSSPVPSAAPVASVPCLRRTTSAPRPAAVAGPESREPEPSIPPPRCPRR